MLNGIKKPILDLENLQEVANKAAEEAAISEVKSFFTSYNSPFRKNIEKWLKQFETELRTCLLKTMAR